MLFWIHEISQSTLAAAVLTLGLVMLLELRSIARLRRSVDGNLERVFEQLDLLRFENQQLIEAQTQSGHRTVTESASARPALTQSTQAAPNSKASVAEESTDRDGLGAGEARLLASLAAARARRQNADALSTAGIARLA